MRTEGTDRQILAVGGSHYISLPPEFVRKNDLKPGDRVGVAYNDILAILVPRLPKGDGDGDSSS